MKTEQLEKKIEDYARQNKKHGTLIIGRYLIQPMYWSEDGNENILYDIESMEEEFHNVIRNLEEHNENSDFDWDTI